MCTLSVWAVSVVDSSVSVVDSHSSSFLLNYGHKCDKSYRCPHLLQFLRPGCCRRMPSLECHFWSAWLGHTLLRLFSQNFSSVLLSPERRLLGIHSSGGWESCTRSMSVAVVWEAETYQSSSLHLWRLVFLLIASPFQASLSASASVPLVLEGRIHSKFLRMEWILQLTASAFVWSSFSRIELRPRLVSLKLKVVWFQLPLS